MNEAGPSISSASTGASEAPVEAEEMEGPGQLWAGAETIKLEELQKRRKKRGIYRKPKKPDYFERLPLVCSCRTMCCCHRTCCCPTSCTCVCNFSSHCEKQARLVTRGVGPVGSRLMVAMGWHPSPWSAQGLGRDGQGIVEPVAAWFYPPGRGLGWRRSGGAGASCSSAPPPGGAGGGWRGRVEEEEEEQQEQERKEEVRREPL